MPAILARRARPRQAASKLNRERAERVRDVAGRGRDGRLGLILAIRTIGGLNRWSGNQVGQVSLNKTSLSWMLYVRSEGNLKPTAAG